jgi:membrane associated rhomboid family serine protease
MRQATIRINLGIAMQLVLVNIVVFILQTILPGFTDQFILIGSEVASRPWTLLTTIFLHGSFSHLLFNMYALFIFGPLVERAVGKRRFLILYFIGGLCASLAATFYPAALGASGAIMAVLGAVIILFPKMKVLFFFIVPMSMRTAGIIFAAIDILGLFHESSGIAHLAHLAGLAFGLIYAWYLLQKGAKFKQRFANKASRFKSTGARTRAKAETRTGQKSYEDTIELTKDDIDEFYKSGRL